LNSNSGSRNPKRRHLKHGRRFGQNLLFFLRRGLVRVHEGWGDVRSRVRSDVFEGLLVEAEVVAEFMQHREADFFANGVFDRTA